MTSRIVKIALCGSVALNIFALAAGGALWVSRERVAQRLSEATPSPVRRAPLKALVAEMEPQVAKDVMETMRARAMEARPDYEEARRARREAIQLTQGDDFNPVEVAALLERSRASEMLGRAHLEVSAVEILGTLSPKDRKALAPILARHGSRGGPGRPSAQSEDVSAQKSADKPAH